MKRIKRSKGRIPFIIVACIVVLIVQGCSKKDPIIKDNIHPIVTIDPTVEPIKPVELSSVTSIDVVTDMSYQEFFTQDPYSELSAYIRETYEEIDPELYNYLFQAVINQKTSVDISSFSLSKEQIMQTCSSLYEQAGFQLFYLSRVKWSNDYKTVNFIYKEYSNDDIAELLATFYSKINHLLYNVAPKDYNSYQRFYSVYDYITKHASYTDDMSDENTHSPYSILMNGKGICGGYSMLANYVLNFVDIPTEYISNEPHAWNMVTLDNKRYHTDMTWGAGYGDVNYLNTILMDDEDRMAGLNNMGFGDYPIIVGYPRNNPITPNSAIDHDFKLYNDIFNNFSLDIDDEYVYFTDYIGINRVKLDGTEKELILEAAVNAFTTYNSVIFYVNENFQLYQYEIGKTPVLLDNSISVNYLKVEDGILIYGDMYEEKEKEIDLNEFSLLKIAKNLNNMENILVMDQQTFEINITFSEEMDTSFLPKEQIGLVCEDRMIPNHMVWNETGDGLIIRTKDLLESGMELKLYVLPGIIDNNGNGTEDGYDMAIIIK